MISWRRGNCLHKKYSHKCKKLWINERIYVQKMFQRKKRYLKSYEAWNNEVKILLIRKAFCGFKMRSRFYDLFFEGTRSRCHNIEYHRARMINPLYTSANCINSNGGMHAGIILKFDSNKWGFCARVKLAGGEGKGSEAGRTRDHQRWQTYRSKDYQ